MKKENEKNQVNNEGVDYDYLDKLNEEIKKEVGLEQSQEEVISDEFDPEIFKQIFTEFTNSIEEDEAEPIEITEEEIEHFKELYNKMSEEKFIDENGEEVTYVDELQADDDQIREFLANIKRKLNQVSDPSNYTEEENIAREKRNKYLETKNGEIMLSIGKPEDFLFDNLTDEERVSYLEKYMDFYEEYEKNLQG